MRRALEETGARLGATGDVLTVVTDVSKPADVDALANAAFDRFGKVNLLINNAGVFASTLAWNVSDAELDWVHGRQSALGRLWYSRVCAAHDRAESDPAMLSRSHPAPGSPSIRVLRPIQ